MSKNTASDKFRRVNVDALDEDNYEDEDLGNEAGPDVAARAKEVGCAAQGEGGGWGMGWGRRWGEEREGVQWGQRNRGKKKERREF